MAQISVKQGSLTGQEGNLLSVATKLRQIEAELDQLKNQINSNHSSSAYRSVARKINSTKSSISRQRTSVTTMRNSLIQIQRIYKNTEKNVDADFHKKSSLNESSIEYSTRAYGEGFKFRLFTRIGPDGVLKLKWPSDDRWFQAAYTGKDGLVSKDSASVLNQPWCRWVLTDKWSSNWDSFFKDLRETGKFDDSILEAATGISGVIFGQELRAQLKSQIVHASVKDKHVVKWDTGKGNMEATHEISAEGTGAKITAEGSYGIISGEASASALTGAASGEAGFVLAKNGKFQPSLKAGAKASGSVTSGKAGYKIGTDDLNHYGETKGDLVGGEAKAGINLGKDGVKAEVGAEGYLAKGEIKGGFELAGIKIDATVEGKAGAVGGKAGGSVSGNAAEAELGASLGLGAGVKVKVDWSGAAKKVEKAWKNRPKWLFR